MRSLNPDLNRSRNQKYHIMPRRDRVNGFKNKTLKLKEKIAEILHPEA